MKHVEILKQGFPLMPKENFYTGLQSFSQFHELVDDAHYQPVPADWFLIISDVKGSTEAIEAGKYKDVNIVGVATIVATQNVMKGEDFPFVFGGDGATLLVPSEKLASVTKSLAGIKALSESKFKLELRVGIISIGELLNENARVEVARYEVVKGRSIAMLRGEGLALAEEKLKHHPDKYNVAANAKHVGDLAGLSCRWQPVKPERGVSLSLLISTRGENQSSSYSRILSEVRDVLEGDIEHGHPIHPESMHYRSIMDCIKDEKRYHQNWFSFPFLLRSLEIFLAVLIFKYKLPAIFFDSKKYQKSMRSHSDFRKFDNMLKMIVDCTEDQARRIEKLLEDKFSNGKLFYGIHRSNRTLMTCYVNNLNDGGHLHFVDGGDGGYAMAAKTLKKQFLLAHA